MKDNILLQIANMLTINFQKIQTPGLLNGQMGIVLFLYEYAKYTNDSYYEEVAGEFFQIILSNKSIPNLTINEGITGFGIGCDYLIKNNLAEGSSDEFLSEYDNAIFQNISNTDLFLSRTNETLFSSGLYFLAREQDLQPEIKELHVDNLINSIESILKKKYSRSLLFYNTILYFLNKIQRMEDLSFSLDSLYNKIFLQITDSIKNNLYDYDDLILLEILQKDIPQKEGCKAFNPEIVKDTQKTDSVSSFIKRTWLRLLFTGNIPQEPLILRDTNNFMEEVLYNYADYDLTLAKGITGLGLGLLKNFSYFEE